MKPAPQRIIGKFDRTVETENFIMYINDTDLTLKCYIGKKSKAAFYYGYKTKELLEDAITRHSNTISANFSKRAEEKLKRKNADAAISAADHFKIGDIVVNSWGYEQTNIEFYSVTKITARKITVHELKKSYVETQFMSGDSVPVDELKPGGDVYSCLIKSGYQGGARIVAPKSYYSFSKWDGRPMYESHYH